MQVTLRDRTTLHLRPKYAQCIEENCVEEEIWWVENVLGLKCYSTSEGKSMVGTSRIFLWLSGMDDLVDQQILYLKLVQQSFRVQKLSDEPMKMLIIRRGCQRIVAQGRSKKRVATRLERWYREASGASWHGALPQKRQGKCVSAKWTKYAFCPDWSWKMWSQ